MNPRVYNAYEWLSPGDKDLARALIEERPDDQGKRSDLGTRERISGMCRRCEGGVGVGVWGVLVRHAKEQVV